MSDPSASGWGRGFRSILRAQETSLIVGDLAIILVVYLAGTKGFFTFSTLSNVTHDVALYGTMALGAAVVIIAGGIDLSVGSVVALSAVLSAQMLQSWLPELVFYEQLPSWAPAAIAIAVSLAAGLVVGLLHAFLINQVRLPPFVATLATMAALRSLAKIVSESRPIAITDRAFYKLGRYPLDYTLWIFLALAVLMSVTMGLTVLGRHLYALGGNENAARLSGLHVNRLKTFAYVASAMLSALAGVLFAGRIGQGDSEMGKAYELWAITAAVVGGCRLAGGAGSIRGTVLGMILVRIIISATAQLNLGVSSDQIEGIVLGVVVVLAVALNQRLRGKS